MNMRHKGAAGFGRAVKVLAFLWMGTGAWAATLRSVDPTLAVPANALGLGGTALKVSGADLANGMTVALLVGRVQVQLLGQALDTRLQTISGRVPNVPAGIYSLRLLDTRGIVLDTLENALEVAPPPTITSVTPGSVSRYGGTAVVIAGTNFRSQTEFLFGTHRVAISSISRDFTEARGVAPALGSAEPDGTYDVTSRDGRGQARLPDGVRYVTPFELDDVSPRLIGTGGGALLTYSGQGFRPGMLLSLGGKPLTEVVVVDDRTATGKAPALAAGFHDALIQLAPGGPPSRKVGIVEASPPPGIRSVTPSESPLQGGITLTIAGANFRAGITQFLVGDLPLQNVEILPVAAGSAARGIAPPNAAGPRDVTAFDVRGSDTLRGGVNYVDASAGGPPAPLITETALAYDLARFDWENPVAYDVIEVLDENDQVVDQIPGDAHRYETSAGGSKSITRKFRGVIRADGPSLAAPGFALIHQCEVPPPLVGIAEPGELVFPLFGDHFAYNDDACADGQGGGGAVAQYEHPMNGLGHLQSGGGGYAVAGSAQLDLDANIFKFLDRKKLTTGFTLEEDADKIQVSLYYEKIAVAANLELRGRLIHVFPDDGFRAEFSFPETLIEGEKNWHSTIFFRTTIEQGTGATVPCEDDQGNLKKIPAGEYLLDFYAVNGEPKLPYYLVADDPLDIELLIKGSPCPPYPMTRVTDLTGLRTVPTIACLDPGPITEGAGGTISLSLHAQGLWTDFDNSVYRIHPDGNLCFEEKGISFTDPWKNSVDFEYSWKIFGAKEDAPIKSGLSGHNPIYPVTLPGYACYKVELTVRDKRCGLESKYSQEVALFPETISCGPTHLASSTCTSPQQFLQAAYFFPTPNPKNIYGVVGLSPPPGTGDFDGKRPVEMRVLVVPCYCGSSSSQINTCPAVSLNNVADPSDDDVEFRLAIKDGSTYVPLTGSGIKVTDPCAEVSIGPKYLLVTIDDIGKIAYQPALGQFEFKPVYFQARLRRKPSGDHAGDPAGCWRNIGAPLRLSNRPDALANSIWNGYFDQETATYHFVSKTSEEVNHNFELGGSPPIPLEVPDVDAAVPGSSSNNVETGLTSRFRASLGSWDHDDAAGTTTGNTLNNDITGTPLKIKGKNTGGGGGSGGGLGPEDYPKYEWCVQETIFNEHFSQTLFEAIIYTGTIGPVPVTVWGSIGLGLDFLLEAYGFVRVAPFAPLNGGNFVETYFDIYSEVKISIPCEIRADILGGLASLAMRLIPEAGLKLQPYFDLKLPQFSFPDIDFYLKTYFSLYFELEACIQTIIFGEQCFGTGRLPIVEEADIIPPHGSLHPRPANCDDSGDGGAVIPQERGEGGGVLQITGYEVAVAPVTIISPDQESYIDIWVKEDAGTLLQVSVNDEPVKSAALPFLAFYLIDPAAAFVANDMALVAWTRPAFPINSLPDSSAPEYLDLANQNAATAEIEIACIARIQESGPGPDWRLFDFVDTDTQPPLFHTVHLLDEGNQIGPDWRADGKPAMAGDLSSGEALVAWVRYDTPDFMIQDGTTTTNVPCSAAEGCQCVTSSGVVPCKFRKVTKPKFRPQMEQTAIFVRRLGFTTEIIPIQGFRANAEHRSQAMKISPPGINIEPSIATSPSGAISYCVWLHDPTHTDLISQNDGRQILFSRYTKNPANLDDPGQWSAPAGALAVPEDFPALLEPKILLRGDDEGLLVFTAIDKSSPARDSGLGSNRYLYASRLEGGVFGEPFRVHGKCRKRQYGYSTSITIDIPELIDPTYKLKWKNPEWVMVFQGLGDPGSRAGSGDVLVTTLNPGSNEWNTPINLTPDNNVHSNVTGALGGGLLRTIHLDGGPSTIAAGQGGGGGILSDKRGFVKKVTAMEPDPAVVGCRLDFPSAGPGSIVKATVEVANEGLVSTPVSTVDGSSALALEMVLLDEEGNEDTVARVDLPEILPGQKIRVPVDVEMPLDPTRLVARVLPGPRDRDLTNNARVCWFGTPKPANLTCEVVVRGVIDEEERASEELAVKLSWESPVVYDEVMIYRDGVQVTSLPGRATRWVDIDTHEGTHLYEVRGRVLVSKSLRTACTIEVVEPVPTGLFRRGDVDGNGRLEITDAIALLGYLFLGSREPGCADAADADDNGRLEITDAVRTLNYLFSGGAAPPAPGPDRCGPDPTRDDLKPCTTTCSQ